MKKKEIIALASYIILVIVGIHLVNIAFPNDYQLYSTDGITYDKATVVAVLSETVEGSLDYEGWVYGEQVLTVRFTSGNQKGEEITITNSLSSTHNIYVSVGTRVIIKSDVPETVAGFYYIYNYDRSGGMFAIVLIFLLAMALLARAKGLKSVLGLGVSLYIIGCFLLPAIYRGWSPILMSVISVLLISSISLLLLNGFCEKATVAIASTMLGVLISVMFFILFQALLKVSGYNFDEVDKLIVIARTTNLQIKQVFFAAVLISSLGAVIDTTMSIAAALYEIRAVNPTIEKTVLVKSGITIGQDMIGTMCQTLILAFVGSAIATLLVLISYGTQVNQFLSSDYVALEIVQAISGSMAIIFAVPITAFLSTLSHTPKVAVPQRQRGTAAQKQKRNRKKR